MREDGRDNTRGLSYRCACTHKPVDQCGAVALRRAARQVEVALQCLDHLVEVLGWHIELATAHAVAHPDGDVDGLQRVWSSAATSLSLRRERSLCGGLGRLTGLARHD